MLCFGIFSLVSFSMECSWIAPLTPAVMVISGLTFQPLLCMVLISGSYLVCLWVRASSRNLSWQYVNSINCIVWLGEGSMGVGDWLWAPIMHNMSGFSLAWHWHFVCKHVHVRSHSGTVWSGGWLVDNLRI
jgi:uncharacterized SAM-binding protein YcdF (DUF218 family)